MVPIDLFDVAASSRRDAEAIVDGAIRVTYAQLSGMTRHIAAQVAAHGEANDPVPVALYGRNSYRLLAAMLGVMRAGGVIVPVHERNTAEKAMPHLRATQPRCLFYDGSCAAEVRRLKQELPSLRQCVALDGRTDDDPGLDDVLLGGDLYVESWIDVSGNPERPVYYWATSGTTGEPKVVIETIRHFNTAVHAARARRSGWANVLLSMAPMSHAGGAVAFTTLALGGKVVIPRNVAPANVLAAIQAERVTELWLSPTALYLLLDFPNRSQFDTSSIKRFLMGMAGVSPDRVRAAVDAFGPCIAHTYGQIETGIVTVLDAETVADAVRGIGPQRLLSSGTNAGINRFAIMDDDGRLLSAGAEGEIVVRGSTVKRYMDEASTAAAQAGGWHRTGDVGYVDEAGYLYVVGRKRDVINVGGLKVAAADVERAVMELGDVRECAVVAVPDALRGEAIKAIVVPASGHSVDTSRIIKHCLARLGVGKAPHSVEEWPELPRSPVGKIDKRQIRDRVSAVIA
jgi:acyl-CoA synthetase (AMP-forming)/AMP-acid ligase II